MNTNMNTREREKREIMTFDHVMTFLKEKRYKCDVIDGATDALHY